MNRRMFLRGGIASGTLGVGAGAFLFVRRSQARAAVTSGLLDYALPTLTSNSLRELNTIPVRAREEIKRYFHGKCLNVEGFVSLLCSNQFAERLGRCQTQEQREECFLLGFSSRVAGSAEMLNWVLTIATEAGSELDSAWDGYCAELRGRWNTSIQGYGKPLAIDELSNRLDGMIRTELAQAARQAVSAYQRPAVGETIGKIGSSALLLLPMCNVGVKVGPKGVAVDANPLVLPVFFLQAVRPIWEYITGRLDDRREEYRASISSRIAILGTRVGAVFEREIRQRLADLHTWQEQSIRNTATRLAEERVSLL